MIYGIWTFTSGQLPTRTIASMKSPPMTIISRAFYPRQLPLINTPGTTTPQAIAPYEIPRGTFAPEYFPPGTITPGQLTLMKFMKFPPGQLTRGLLPPDIFP